MPEVILRLLVHPALRARPKGDGQPHGHLRTDTSTTVEQSRQRLAAYAQGIRCVRDRHVQRLKTELANDLARVGRVMHSHNAPSMIVLVVNVNRVFTAEAKCDAPIAANTHRPSTTARA